MEPRREALRFEFSVPVTSRATLRSVGGSISIELILLHVRAERGSLRREFLGIWGDGSAGEELPVANDEEQDGEDGCADEEEQGGVSVFQAVEHFGRPGPCVAGALIGPISKEQVRRVEL